MTETRHMGFEPRSVGRREARKLLASGEDASVVTDGRGLILVANDAADELFAARAGTLIGTALPARFVRADVRTVVAMMKGSAPPAETELRLRSRDRDAFPAAVTM